MESAIYAKTEQGVAEIQARTLPLKLRRVLIMVDGHLDVRALAERSGCEDAQALLAELETGGYVTRVGVSAKPKAEPEPATADPARSAHSNTSPHAGSAPSAVRQVPLALLQRTAARRLADLLGPQGDAVAIRIEKTKSVTEWETAIGTAVELVRMMRGAAAASAFADEMAALAAGSS